MILTFKGWSKSIYIHKNIKYTQLNFNFFLYFMYVRVYVHMHYIWKELRQLKVGNENFSNKYFAFLECLQQADTVTIIFSFNKEVIFSLFSFLAVQMGLGAQC